ncbi:hypothetical protein MRB53_042395 [Persea americana]|nr:hypothetical protein MRB53_042395 [Persea americana]
MQSARSRVVGLRIACCLGVNIAKPFVLHQDKHNSRAQPPDLSTHGRMWFKSPPTQRRVQVVQKRLGSLRDATHREARGRKDGRRGGDSCRPAIHDRCFEFKFCLRPVVYDASLCFSPGRWSCRKRERGHVPSSKSAAACEVAGDDALSRIGRPRSGLAVSDSYRGIKGISATRRRLVTRHSPLVSRQSGDVIVKQSCSAFPRSPSVSLIYPISPFTHHRPYITITATMSLKDNDFPASANFEAISSALNNEKEKKDAIKQAKAIFAFTLKNSSGKEASWYVDLKETGTVGKGVAPAGKKPNGESRRAVPLAAPHVLIRIRSHSQPVRGELRCPHRRQGQRTKAVHGRQAEACRCDTLRGGQNAVKALHLIIYGISLRRSLRRNELDGETVAGDGREMYCNPANQTHGGSKHRILEPSTQSQVIPFTEPLLRRHSIHLGKRMVHGKRMVVDKMRL